MASFPYALRTLYKSPSFSVALIATLAIGIAASVAVFTVTSALLLRPLPYEQPNRLVLLDAQKTDDHSSNGFTLNRYELFRDQSRTLSGVAVAATESMNMSGIGEPEQISVARVSGNFFGVLGIKPSLGRGFSDGDATAGSAPVVVISDALWRERFGADPHVVGSTLNLDGVPETIVGVLPRVQFPFISPADIWLPRYFELTLFPTERLRRGVGYLTAVGRMRDGTSLENTRAEMELLHRRYSEANPTAPDAGTNFEVKVGNLQELSIGDLRSRLLLLSSAVALVLLIAIANAAGLLLSRALARRQEIAVRVAMGASRGAIIRQLLAECLLLASVAGVCGFVLALICVRALGWLAKGQLPDAAFTLDWRVLAFTSLVTLVSGLLFGIVPAMRLSRPDLVSALRVEGAGSTSAPQQQWYRNALVAGETALTVVLLVGALLVTRSFVRLLRTDAGFEPAGLITFNISLPTLKYANAQQQTSFFDELLRKVSTVPGVDAAAISSTVPLIPKRISPVLPEGQPEVPLQERPFVNVEMISPGWFRALSVPLRQGRDFSTADRIDAPKVIIVNQAFARRFWPNSDAIGKHVALGRQTASEVVGVSADVRNNGIAAVAQPQIYVPYAQLAWSNMNVLVRAKAGLEPSTLLPALRQQIWSIDPDEPVANVQSGYELLSTSRAERRFTTLLIAGFASAAFILSMVGISGLLAYSVAQRRRELAIRMALGASNERVLAFVMRQGLQVTVAGMIIGLCGAAVASRWLSSLLYGTAPLDVVSFVLAAAGFLLVSVIAMYLPARRTTRLSPVEAMR